MPVAPSTSPAAHNAAPGDRVPRGLARFAAGLVAVTFGLLVVGASVRVHGAGLACPDWPLCFGEVIPTIDFGVAFEFGHRVLAGLVSVGFVALLVGIARRRASLPAAIPVVAGLALVTLAVQVVLGGLTVLELLAQWTVTSHLLAGNTFCLLLLLLALGLHEAGRSVARVPVTHAARAAGAGLSVLVLAQLVVGGLVSSSHAGLVCGPVWPACANGAWLPTVGGPIGLHLAHRLVAYALLMAAGVTWVASRAAPRPRRAATAVLVAVCAQAVIGVVNVLGALPVEVTLLHTAGAAAIVLATTWLNRELWLAPARSAEPAHRLALGAA